MTSGPTRTRQDHDRAALSTSSTTKRTCTPPTVRTVPADPATMTSESLSTCRTWGDHSDHRAGRR